MGSHHCRSCVETNPNCSIQVNYLLTEMCLQLHCYNPNANYFSAQCTHLDARRFSAQCTHLDARRFGARHSVHAPRRSMLGASTPRHSTLRHPTLGASTPRRSVHAPRRSVHAPRRSTLRRFDARCTHLDASALDARRRLDQCTHHDVWVPSMRDLSGQVACQRSARQLRVVFGAGPCRICPGR
ncbi:UNVERIFIED_CONTAM: hypothetical protein FKN15_078100 [Acipenser sinensis]